MMRFLSIGMFAAALLPAQVQGTESPAQVHQAQPLSPGSAPEHKQEGPGVTSAKSNPWFPEVDKDLGTYFNNEAATGTYKFRNPSKDPQQWRTLQGSCTCSRAIIRVADRTYEMPGKSNPGLFRVTKENGVDKKEKINQIEINPGEEGEVEVHMEMGGVTGIKRASLDIHMTDPDTPMVKLNFSATGATLFQLTPNEVNLNTMTWNEKREFVVQVTSPVAKDFAITRMDPLPEGFDVKYEKALKDGIAVWTVSGSYGPLKSETGGGATLKFYTNLKGETPFSLRVTAFVKGPLEVKPGSFLTLGMIRFGSGHTERVVFEPNDGTNLEAIKVHFEKLSTDQEFVTARTSKDGNKLIVEIEVSKNCPKGLVRGDMVVELNHPAIKEKRILFNGFVR